MWTLIVVWLAGGFASLGIVRALVLSENTELETKIYIMRFVESWYGFGMLLTYILRDIGKSVIVKEKKSDN